MNIKENKGPNSSGCFLNRRRLSRHEGDTIYPKLCRIRQATRLTTSRDRGVKCYGSSKAVHNNSCLQLDDEPSRGIGKKTLTWACQGWAGGLCFQRQGLLGTSGATCHRPSSSTAPPPCPAKKHIVFVEFVACTKKAFVASGRDGFTPVGFLARVAIDRLHIDRAMIYV